MDRFHPLGEALRQKRDRREREQAEPVFDRVLAARLVERGAEVGAMTPGELAAWFAEKLRR